MLLALLQTEELQARIDGLYQSAFAQPASKENGSGGSEVAEPSSAATSGLNEEAFGRLGRTHPEVRILVCIEGISDDLEVEFQESKVTTFLSLRAF